MNRLMYFITAIHFFLGAPGVINADEVNEEFKYGDRPSDSVFDPTGLLATTQRNEISKPLQNILREEGIDVMVIVLPEIGEAPPEYVAQGFDEEWSKTGISAVVLHVPGGQGSPWILPGNAISDLVKPDVLEKSVDAAEKRAAAEPDDPAKIRAASIEAADLMRYWTGSAVIRTESVINDRLNRQLAFEKRKRLLKIAALLGAAGAIPILTGLIFFFSRLKNRKSRVFPPVRKIARLGAPYSGGNNAISRIK